MNCGRTLRPLEDLLELNVDGVLPSIANVNLSNPWKYSISYIVKGYQGCFQERLHSVYIRGSVARGTAILGLSDIDTICVVHKLLTSDQKSLDKLEKDLAARLGFSDGVEVSAYELKSVIENKNYDPVRFVLKILSKCISGHNIAVDIQDYKISDVPKLCLPYLSDNLEITPILLEVAPSNLERRRVCRWIMKQIIRSGFEINLHLGRVYTRDLYHCASKFCEAFPKLRKKMWRAVRLAVAPVSDSKSILKATDLGQDIIHLARVQTTARSGLLSG